MRLVPNNTANARSVLPWWAEEKTWTDVSYLSRVQTVMTWLWSWPSEALPGQTTGCAPSHAPVITLITGRQPAYVCSSQMGFLSSVRWGLHHIHKQSCTAWTQANFWTFAFKQAFNLFFISMLFACFCCLYFQILVFIVKHFVIVIWERCDINKLY